jgi:hypothetical protein
MRLLVRGLCALATLCLAGVVEAQAPNPAMGPVMVQGYANAAIAAHARRVGGTAPRESRKTCEGDLNGDGRGDVVVVYTIEGAGGGGGNGWTQYLIVLTVAPQGLGSTAPKEVGRTGDRGVESCRVVAGKIEAATKVYLPTDPSCCPSKPGTLTLTLEKGKLVDVPAPTSSTL